MTRETDSTASIQEQASYWWELFHGEEASSADHREFAEWVARSPERVEAYLQTARLIHALKSPQVRWPATPAADLIHAVKSAPAEALPFSAGRSGAFRAQQSPSPAFRIRFALGAIATLLLGIGFAWVITERPREFKTDIGEQRSILLGDGTRVTLNTASTMEVRFRKGERQIRLIKGEALFDVAHDAARPFMVRAGDTALTDVGTQFNVDMRPARTTVTVLDGRVAVDSGGATEGPLVLGASDSVVITRSGRGIPKHGSNVSAAVAWTLRQLMFEHRPLSEVAEEFNRYNRDRIDIDSTELQRQEVTGVFQAKDPASFIAFLSNIPGVEVRDRLDGTHIVTLRKNPSTR